MLVKSLNLYTDIKKNLFKEKIFLIVPEQSNLTAEQNLFKTLKVERALCEDYERGRLNGT